MAIYISGVKGLPEQVQENKENIKTIQEEIEGIDFDHIRELDDQVAENTGDINNLEGAIGVQNIAIESINDTIDDNLKPRIETLENKTTAISYDSQNNPLTTIDSSAKVNGNIYANTMQDENQLGAITIPENANESVVILNNSGGTLHSLIFDKDGNLLIDGNPAGKTYYRHVIGFRHNQVFYSFEVISTQAEAYTSNTLLAYLQPWNNGTFAGISYHLIGSSSTYNLTSILLVPSTSQWLIYYGNNLNYQEATLPYFTDIVSEI